MKATFVIAATAGLVAAQDLSSLPECAASCVSEALAAQNCSDAECACTDEVQSAITPVVISCLDTNECPSEDLVALTEFQATSCSDDASSSDAASSGAADVTSAAETEVAEPTEAATSAAEEAEPTDAEEATDAAEPTEAATATEDAEDAEETGSSSGSASGNTTSGGNSTSGSDDDETADVSGAMKSTFFGFATLLAGLLIAV